MSAHDKFETASDLLYQGDLSRALSLVDEALAEEPHHAGGHALRGRILTLTGDLPAAKKSVSRAMEIDPDFATAYFVAGLIDEVQGDRNQAVLWYGRAVDLEPDQIGFLCALAEGLLSLDRIPEAQATVAQIETLDPFDPAVLVLRARLAWLNDERDKARECLEAAIKLDPRDSEARRILAAVELGSDRPEAALVHAEVLLEQEPRDSEALAVLLDCQTSLGDLEAARAACDTHLKATPQSALGHAMLAHVSILQGDLETAGPAIEKAVSLDSEAAYVCLTRARYERARGAFGPAAGYYKTALEADPSNIDSYLELMDCMLRLGREEEAGRVFQEAFSAARGSVEALFSVAANAEDAGWDVEAVACAEAILELEPGNELAELLIGFAALRSLDAGKARLIAQAVLARDPQSEGAQVLLERADEAETLPGRFRHTLARLLLGAGQLANRLADRIKRSGGLR